MILRRATTALVRRATTASAVGLCLVLCVCSGGWLRVARTLGAADCEAFAAASELVATHVSYSTLAGSDRYGTAVAISREAYPDTADVVVLADGVRWPDALGGGVLAGANEGPVLLLEPAGLGEATAAEIRRLRPVRVFVLGGSAVVSDEVFASVIDVAGPGASVTRLAGDDRYSTAATVASQAIDAFPVWGGTALVASGHSYADALAAGPYAIASGRPIFLIDDAHAPQVASSMSAAGVTRLIVLGGDEAVSPAVRAVLAGEFGAANVDRLAGADRYQTAALLADVAVKYSGLSLGEPGLAAGAGFADALTAAPLLAQRNSPLILVPQAKATDALADWLYSRRSEIAGFIAFGGDSALPGQIRQDVLLSLAAPRFDVARAMAHVRALAGYGSRRAGGTAERRALDYFAEELSSYGYTVGTQQVVIPGGLSGNVLAQKRGTLPGVIVIGAHADSKAPSPGANDNASGVAVTLELARVLAQAPVAPTVRFIAFGAEEISGSTADDHHFGSRGYVRALGDEQRADISGMVSVDMVGYGDTFNVRSLGAGAKTVVYSLQGRAAYTGLELPYLRDPGRYGWSDHEGFERAGIPAAWLEWREDPVYHTVLDTASHVDAARVESTGRLVRGWLLSMSPAQLDSLR